MKKCSLKTCQTLNGISSTLSCMGKAISVINYDNSDTTGLAETIPVLVSIFDFLSNYRLNPASNWKSHFRTCLILNYFGEPGCSGVDV
jgi:hypothetical protein